MDVFSTNVLIGVVSSLKPAPQFLLDRFFPRIQTEDSEEIHFDVVQRTRRVAPFVSPLVAGKIMEAQGHSTKTFKPAYLKPKTPFSPRRAIKRMAGEPMAGSMSPQQRIDRLLMQDLEEHINQINRRLEVMAGESMRTGQLVVSGDNYPTVVVDFGRDAGNTIVKGAGTHWGDAGISPLDDLQDWSQVVLKSEGVSVNDVVMDVDTWKIFRADAAVTQRLDTRRLLDNAMTQKAQMQEGGVYMGTVDGFNIYVYSGWYIDDAGVEQPIMPSGTVLLSGPTLEGVRAFGSIEDHDAGLQALPYFPKSWVEKDPSMRYLMTQSAPLVVPTRINATLAATVL